MIIYEDNDPWNWTCADNQQWLDTFKYQQGIGGVTEVVAASKTLAEVPILAPYVIKGGLKSKPATAPSHQRRNLSTDSTCDSSNVTPDYGSVPHSATAATFDNGMDLDFDGVDFSSLDIGMMDDMSFDMPLDNSGNGGMAGSMGISTTPFSSSIPGETLFGSYSVSPGMNMGMGVNPGMPLQYQQTRPRNGSGELMSEQDLNQLSGYMAGFN
jgi:hypothetical protein